MRFDLAEGFPLVTTKKMHARSIIHELLWFLAGGTNVRYLQQQKVKIWDKWAVENGDLGPVYGRQWRSWPAPDGSAIDQIAKVVQDPPRPRFAPLDRHRLESADAEKMKLPPCHCLFANGPLVQIPGTGVIWRICPQ